MVRLDSFASLAMTSHSYGVITKLRIAAALFIVALIVAASAVARADSYPSKTITIIAPASPGGVTDLLARMLARRFIADWGAQAIVENKPGANNQVAAEFSQGVGKITDVAVIADQRTTFLSRKLSKKLPQLMVRT